MAKVGGGSWVIDKGIRAKWIAADLDSIFRGSSPVTEYPVLRDDEARPAPPHPYCVLDITEPTPLNRATGTESAHREHVEYLVTVAFRIHARQTAQYSAKKAAILLAQYVAGAFDDAELDIYPNRQNIWQRVGDTGTQEDDDGYLWAVMYEMRYDEQVARTVRKNVEAG